MTNLEGDKTSTKVMDASEFRQIEHEIQTGVRDTLPGGLTISDAQKNLKELQDKQAADWGKKKDSDGKILDVDVESPSSGRVEVTTTPTGVMSARPLGEVAMLEQPENPNSGSDSNTEPDNDLPGDLPGRKALIAAGVTSLEAVGKLDKAALVALNGIGEATADAILAYGKADSDGDESEGQ